MRILIAAQNYHANLNGAGVFTVNLAEGLARNGHEVVVLAPSERRKGYRTQRNGVTLQTIAALPLTAGVFVTPHPGEAVAHALDEFRPQVVHLQDHYPLCRGVLAAARRRGLPLVATNHFLPENIIAQVPPFRLIEGTARRIMWQQALAVLNAADVMTTPTRTAADILAAQGLRPPVQVISCGVDVERFSPRAAADRNELYTRYGLAPGRPLFIYVGRVEADKSLDVLLCAMRQLVEKADAQLAIVGRGNRLAALRAQARGWGLDGRVIFTGYVPPSDLPGLVASADLFTMPSTVELQSIATLEAMATGRPVLAARARALPELVKDGVNGYLFAPGDCHEAARRMLDFLSHRGEWTAMGAAGRALALRHDVRQTHAAYARLYADLVRQRAGSRRPLS